MFDFLASVHSKLLEQLECSPLRSPGVADSGKHGRSISHEKCALIDLILSKLFYPSLWDYVRLVTLERAVGSL